MSSLRPDDVAAEDRDELAMSIQKWLRKDRTFVLFGLLLASCCTAALAQWLPRHASAEAERPVRSSRAVAEVAVEMILDVDEPAEAASEPEPLVEQAAAQPEPERTVKVRDSHALVRDANRLARLQPALARPLFELAAATDPRNPHAHAGLAHTLYALGKPVEAREAIERALRIRPKRESYKAFASALDATK